MPAWLAKLLAAGIGAVAPVLGDKIRQAFGSDASGEKLEPALGQSEADKSRQDLDDRRRARRNNVH